MLPPSAKRGVRNHWKADLFATPRSAIRVAWIVVKVVDEMAASAQPKSQTL